MLLKDFTKRIQAIGLLFLLSTVVISCGSKKVSKQEKKVLPVKAEKVMLTSSVQQKQFPSIVRESEEVNLPFRVAGPIHLIKVKEGDFVRKGQLLAQIDPRDYKLQKSVAEAQYNQVKGESERVTELYNRKSVAGNDYDKMVAGEKMASAKLKQTGDQLADTRLVAPFSGYVTKVLFEEGEMVNRGVPIVSLIDVSVYELEVDIPTSLYMNRDRFLSFSVTHKDLPGQEIPVTLFSQSNKANHHGMYRLYLHLNPEEAKELAPGMNVQLTINYKETDSDIATIPLSAVFRHNNADCVWVIDNQNHIHRRIIDKSNHILEGRVQVLEGVKANEKIVVGGLNLLSEGAEVKQVNKQSETNVGNLL